LLEYTHKALDENDVRFVVVAMGCLLSLCFEVRPIPTVSIAKVSHLSLLFHSTGIVDCQFIIHHGAVCH